MVSVLLWAALPVLLLVLAYMLTAHSFQVMEQGGLGAGLGWAGQDSGSACWPGQQAARLDWACSRCLKGPALHELPRTPHVLGKCPANVQPGVGFSCS